MKAGCGAVCGAVAYRGGQYDSFLDPCTGRLVTIKVPEEPPRQPQHPVMGALAIEPRWGSYGDCGCPAGICKLVWR